jgi:hypothetical protein
MNAKPGRVARNMYRSPNGVRISENPRLICLMINYAMGQSGAVPLPIAGRGSARVAERIGR